LRRMQKLRRANKRTRNLQFKVMGLEKAIEHGKEKRRPYKGAKAVVCSCRNHGTCEWCRGNRTHNTNRKMEKAKAEMKEVQ